MSGGDGRFHLVTIRSNDPPPFDLPDGCVGGYPSEMNPLAPLWYHDKVSKTPPKGVPVRIERVAQEA